MAGGRRNINRAANRQQQHQTYAANDDKSRCGASTSVDGPGLKTASPKHMPFPSLPTDSCVTFELIMFMFTTTSTFLQFLHLYRSVWWLPQSFSMHSMNFYLIDPYLIAFIVIIHVRRLLFYAMRKLVFSWAPTHVWDPIENAMRLSFLFVLLSTLSWCAYKVTQNHAFINIFYLCYPVFVYFILFGLSVGPFFDVFSPPHDIGKDEKVRILGKPTHSCSSSPHAIREEVNYLKRDFNNRMKQVLFSSMLNAYYAGFVPCCFAQSYLFYDVYWATQHLTFIWIGGLTMYLVHCFPIKYCDTLHRATLHLGKWVKLEGRACHLPSHLWSENTLWTQGALVKHCKELYKGEGISNAAEPGNSSHYRFYSVFYNPSFLMCTLVGLQLSVVLLQLAILIRTSEWYQVLSLSLLLFANYYTLFKLARDYLICWKVYKAEAMIQDKSHAG